MRLVITGASGQLGRRVAELVLGAAAPADLILTTRTPEVLASFAARGVAVRQADFAAPETLGAAFAGGERLLLVSATDLERRGARNVPPAGITNTSGCSWSFGVIGCTWASSPPNRRAKATWALRSTRC